VKPLPPPNFPGIVRYDPPEPIDLQARRAANQPKDKDGIAHALAEAAEGLCATFRSWPLRFLRDEDLQAAERDLATMRGRLAELRALITETTPPAAA
jgi:hypothetical protein